MKNQVDALSGIIITIVLIFAFMFGIYVLVGDFSSSSDSTNSAQEDRIREAEYQKQQAEDRAEEAEAATEEAEYEREQAEYDKQQAEQEAEDAAAELE
jgi:uncharacterized protein (UPF0333 family)